MPGYICLKYDWWKVEAANPAGTQPKRGATVQRAEKKDCGDNQYDAFTISEGARSEWLDYAQPIPGDTAPRRILPDAKRNRSAAYACRTGHMGY